MRSDVSVKVAPKPWWIKPKLSAAIGWILQELRLTLHLNGTGVKTQHNFFTTEKAMACPFKKDSLFRDSYNYSYITKDHHHNTYVPSKPHDAICSLREWLAKTPSMRISLWHICIKESQERCTRGSTSNTPSIFRDLVMVLPQARLLAWLGTALMNIAWGHLPPLNYRSVEAQHMGTAQQVLMASSP